MSQAERFDRELTSWFDETAVPSIPDWTEEVLALTSRTRQRPRWAFLSRWLPTNASTIPGALAPRVPWRAVALGAMLLVALVAGAILIAGGRSRVPSPFGLADNGLVAYSKGGDIHVVDPVTGERRTIVAGREFDTDPRWSLDGTRIAFFRKVGMGVVPAFSKADGTGVTVAQLDRLVTISSDTITWSPASDAIAFWADGTVYVVEASDGRVTKLIPPMIDGEPFWRPPEGRQLLYASGSESHPMLVLVDTVTGAVEELRLPDGARVKRASGWTPGGETFAFSGDTARFGGGTHLVEMETGRMTRVPVGYGQLSNDGTRIVGLDPDGTETKNWMCVAWTAGGPCTAISEPIEDLWGTYYRWSPDDEWIITIREDGAMLALDPDGLLAEQPPWMAEGAESFQRIVRP